MKLPENCGRRIDYNRHIDVQTALAISVPTMAVLIGILINNSRLSDLRAHVDSRFSSVDQRFPGIDQRIDDLRATLRAELLRVEGVLDARLTNVEQRLSHLEER